MEKFLSIPVTSQGVQLVSANNIVLVEAASDSATATTTLITYAGGNVVTLTHAAQVAFSMKLAIQEAIVAALQTSWANVVYDVVVPASS
jgi:hypothetical protein